MELNGFLEGDGKFFWMGIVKNRSRYSGCKTQSSTIIKWPYMILYVCQNFGVHDVHGKIPKSIYQAL